MTPTQCKMARAGLGWGVRDLGAKANVAANTVVRFEQGGGVHSRTIDALRAALEAAGVEFLGEDGVRLREGQGE